MTQSKKRLFVGIGLSEFLLPSIGELIEKLRIKYQQEGLRIAWVKPESVHLTLKFLGPTAPEQIPSICEELRQIAASEPCFHLALQGIGAFESGRGRIRTPYPLWLGVSKTPSVVVLKGLVERVEASLACLGFSSESREWVPHLTLARVKELPRHLVLPPGTDPSEKLIEIGCFEVQRMTLFESQLCPTGAVYAPLCELPFKLWEAEGN